MFQIHVHFITVSLICKGKKQVFLSDPSGRTKIYAGTE